MISWRRHFHPLALLAALALLLFQAQVPERVASLLADAADAAFWAGSLCLGDGGGKQAPNGSDPLHRHSPCPDGLACCSSPGLLPTTTVMPPPSCRPGRPAGLRRAASPPPHRPNQRPYARAPPASSPVDLATL